MLNQLQIRVKCRRLFIWMTGLALSVFCYACGSGDHGAEVTPAEASRQAVLTSDQLPKGSKEASKPLLGETCSPVSYFRDYAQAVAASPGVYLSDAEMIQQVGIFKTEKEARKAFARVTSKSALNCVEARMEEASVSFTGSRGNLTSEIISPPVGTTASRTFRLELTNGFGWVEIKRTAILDGDGITTLTFISQAPPLDQGEWSKLCREAARSLRQAISA